MAKLWALLVVAGCAQVPNRSEDAARFEVSRQPDGSVRSVRTTDGLYEMQFAATGVRLPSGLRIGDVEVLGQGDACYNERGIGVAVFPAINVVGDTPADPALPNTIELLRDGPILVQVEVTFGASYDCNGPQQVTGKTTFTFFPSGRIVRRDRDLSPTTTVATGDQCACNADGTSTYFFTSFWAFLQRPEGAQFTRAGEPVETASEEPAVCTIYPERAIAVNFAGSTTRYPSNGAFTHVFDFASDVPEVGPQQANLFSAVQLVDRRNVQSQECAGLLAALDDPRVFRVEDAAPIGTDENGIYFIDSPRPNGVSFRPTARIPGGFVVSIDLGDLRHFVVYKNGTIAATPPSQPDPLAGPNRFLFLFEEDLAADVPIRFEPADRDP